METYVGKSRLTPKDCSKRKIAHEKYGHLRLKNSKEREVLNKTLVGNLV
jgi:hypothetical protein